MDTFLISISFFLSLWCRSQLNFLLWMTNGGHNCLKLKFNVISLKAIWLWKWMFLLRLKMCLRLEFTIGQLIPLISRANCLAKEDLPVFMKSGKKLCLNRDWIGQMLVYGNVLSYRLVLLNYATVLLLITVQYIRIRLRIQFLRDILELTGLSYVIKYYFDSYKRYL